MGTVKNIYTLIAVMVLGLFVFTGCIPKYVEVDRETNEIKFNCYSIKPPTKGVWQKSSSFYELHCENFFVLTRGSGEDLYWIYFISDRTEYWDDKYDTQYMMNETETSLEFFKRKMLDYQKYGIEGITSEVEVVEGIKGPRDAVIKLHYEFVSPTPVIYRLGGKGHVEETSLAGYDKLRPSNRYYYDVIQYNVSEGPYKWFFGDSAIFYKVILVHVSVTGQKDPDLETTALEFLNNVKFIQWSKIEEDNV